MTVIETCPQCDGEGLVECPRCSVLIRVIQTRGYSHTLPFACSVCGDRHEIRCPTCSGAGGIGVSVRRMVTEE